MVKINNLKSILFLGVFVLVMFFLDGGVAFATQAVSKAKMTSRAYVNKLVSKKVVSEKILESNSQIEIYDTKLIINNRAEDKKDKPIEYENKNIKKQLDANKERLFSLNIQFLPNDKNSIIFSTVKFLGGNESDLSQKKSLVENRLYTYNLKTKKLLKFYQESSDNNTPAFSKVFSVYNHRSGRHLRVEGLAGSKLLVQFDDPNNSPGPCTNDWYNYQNSFGYLELSNLKAGIKPYQVPEYKIKESKLRSENCLKDIQNY